MKKIAWLFPGQGSQYVGMGKGLCAEFAVADRTFEEASDLLGLDLKELCWSGPEEALTLTANAQPALLAMSVAAFRVYMQEVGIAPKFLAGHSLGEYSALTAAGAMAFADALRIVRKRGELMQEAVAVGAGAMVAVNDIERAELEAAVAELTQSGETIALACLNSKTQYVVSGTAEAADRLERSLVASGVRVSRLKVSAPFHSALMESAARGLQEELMRYTYQTPKWPVIANVTAKPYASAEEIVPNLTLQMTQPVRWQETMQLLNISPVGTVLELGSKHVLCRLTQENTRRLQALSFDNQADREVVFSWKEQVPQVVTRCLATAVAMKNRNFDAKEYEVGVVAPYRELEALQQQLDEGIVLTDGQEAHALDLLFTILNTKLVPLEQQWVRFQQLFEETCTEAKYADFLERKYSDVFEVLGS